jgi:cytochrome c biogenesis protein CcdA
MTMNLLSVIALGFFLGMRHATDPDHVVAVSTIVSRHRSMKHAAVIGAFWGLGHTITILLVGGGIIFFGWVIPARVGLSMELSVGVMLILLGVLNLTGMQQRMTDALSVAGHSHGAVHSHPHAHGDYVHSHPHMHDPESHPHATAQTPLHWLDGHLGSLGIYQMVRPLVVGLVHGLAGSAAVALLVLAAIHDPKWGAFYLAIFGVGTIAGMMIITGAMGIPFTYGQGRFARFNQFLRVASGAISVVFGLFLVYQIGFVSGLFTSHPHWTPT